MMKTVKLLLVGLISLSCLQRHSSENQVTSDSIFEANDEVRHLVVWFENQYLSDGKAFLKKAASFNGSKRSAVRKEVVPALKAISDQSFNQIEPQLDQLKKAGQIKQIRQHWIINGFSCLVTPEGHAALQKIESIAYMFTKQPLASAPGTNMGPEFLSSIPTSRFKTDLVENYPWNLKKIRAPEVWNEFGITGNGVLNVVHDGGFKLDIPPLAETIYTNKGEVPGNGKDDDGNGYIDDYHGFHFDEGNANLNEPTIRRGTNIHGNLCAAMICGTFATDSRQAIGIAPESRWAPVIAASNIEESVEWAIEQGADTYSMSFSQPNLGEYRNHWRKVLEHATLCGVVFISGAGNFAGGPNAAPIPVQMRNPEDIPNAVLGVAGVGEDGQRPFFSSQGPVVWETGYYTDGQVNKPDFATLNFQVPCVDPEGKLTNMASGNSLAGPHMAGIISLMLSANPELLPWEIKDILIETAQDIGDPGFDFQSGHGFVNAYDAVKAVIDQ